MLFVRDSGDDERALPRLIVRVQFPLVARAREGGVHGGHGGLPGYVTRYFRSAIRRTTANALRRVPAPVAGDVFTSSSFSRNRSFRGGTPGYAPGGVAGEDSTAVFPHYSTGIFNSSTLISKRDRGGSGTGTDGPILYIIHCDSSAMAPRTYDAAAHHMAVLDDAIISTGDRAGRRAGGENLRIDQGQVLYRTIIIRYEALVQPGNRMPVAIERAVIDKTLPFCLPHIDIGGEGAVDTVKANHFVCGRRPLQQALGGIDGVVAIGIRGVVLLGGGAFAKIVLWLYPFTYGDLARADLLIKGQCQRIGVAPLERKRRGFPEVGIAPVGERHVERRRLRHEDALVGAARGVVPHLDLAGRRVRCRYVATRQVERGGRHRAPEGDIAHLYRTRLALLLDGDRQLAQLVGEGNIQLRALHLARGMEQVRALQVVRRLVRVYGKGQALARMPLLIGRVGVVGLPTSRQGYSPPRSYRYSRCHP